jgi:hypothetical protein
MSICMSVRIYLFAYIYLRISICIYLFAYIVHVYIVHVYFSACLFFCISIFLIYSTRCTSVDKPVTMHLCFPDGVEQASVCVIDG